MPKDKFENHLKNETSPYLKQHMFNPVNWYPWGEEALQKAKEEDKLIFLSIGYSTCHWCHVMAHESFEDVAVASLLNDSYVCIKVDREERPDLDTIYMNYCQLMTGSGGWPLNLWLTPEQVPIYAGTYFPKQDTHGRPGFISVLSHLRKMWQEDKEELLDKSQSIVAHVAKHTALKPESVDQFVTVQAVRDLKERFDEQYGGFGGAPKFPSPHQLLFLMHDYMKQPEESNLAMVTKTLDSMYKGGIYDHVGGGFSRYSVDGRWLVPHFEKMLYDNALLLRVYNLGYQITGRQLYKDIAYDILRFLKRDMLNTEGGFYTALDADSEGVEGKYYVYSRDDIQSVLGDDSDGYMERFDISVGGNFEGSNIPNLIGQEISSVLIDEYSESNELLYAFRKMRVAPGRDNKVLTSVNGLLLGSLAYMYRLHRDTDVLDLAKGIFRFVENSAVVQGQLTGVVTEGITGGSAVLEDYAFYIEGLIELYQGTFDQKYLDRAKVLGKILKGDYWDSEGGGYFMTSITGERLISRPKESYDSALPSGNSVMSLNLMKLSRLEEDTSYQDDYDLLIKAFGKRIKQGPSYHCYLMIGLIYRQKGTRDLSIATVDGYETSDIQSEVTEKLLDFFTVRVDRQHPEKKAINGKTTYYICENYACGLPMDHL